MGQSPLGFSIPSHPSAQVGLSTFPCTPVSPTCNIERFAKVSRIDNFAHQNPNQAHMMGDCIQLSLLCVLTGDAESRRMSNDFGKKWQILRWMLFSALGFMMAVAGIASAEAKAPRGDYCDGSDSGSSLCKKSKREQQRKAFGLPSIETYKQSGARAVRILANNAYGWPTYAIIFYQDRDLVPKVEFRRPLDQSGMHWRAPLIARVNDADWQTILEKQRALQSTTSEDNICLDGYTRTVELIDAGGTVDTWVEHSCGQSLMDLYINYLTQLGLDQFAQCKAIVSQYSHDDASYILSICSLLDGDRMAAAKLHNQLDAHGLTGRSNWREIVHLFDNTAAFSWPGMPVATGAEASAKLWIEKDPTIQSYIGETSDRVRLEGRVSISVDEVRETTVATSAPFVSIWIRGKDGQFRMQSFSR